jgi:hypothetical protein
MHHRDAARLPFSRQILSGFEGSEGAGMSAAAQQST